MFFFRFVSFISAAFKRSHAHCRWLLFVLHSVWFYKPITRYRMAQAWARCPYYSNNGGGEDGLRILVMDSLGILWWRMDTVIPFGWMNGYDDMHADTILEIGRASCRERVSR